MAEVSDLGLLTVLSVDFIALVNSLPPIINSLKKQKTLYKVLMPNFNNAPTVFHTIRPELSLFDILVFFSKTMYTMDVYYI